MLKIAIEELPALIKLAYASRNNVLVVGDPGVGKSFVIEGMRSDTCHVYSMTGSSTIEEYVNGIPQVAENENGYKQLEYIPSKWLVDIVDTAKKNPDYMQILFIDEFNTADPQVLKTFLTILSERRIPTCDIALPDNVVIVAAMNPQDQNQGEPLIRPLASRFMTVEIMSSIDQYRKFIAGKSSSITRCDFALSEPKPLPLTEQDYLVRSVPIDEWGKFVEGESMHEINSRSFTNFLRALSYCANQEECCPLLSNAFLGILLKMRTKKTSGKGSTGYLHAKELAKLDDAKLHEYASTIYRDADDSMDAKTARLLLQQELAKRGLNMSYIGVMGEGTKNDEQ